MDSATSDSKFEKTLYIKNMVCGCCSKLVQFSFEKIGLEVIRVVPGSCTIRYHLGDFQESQVVEILQELGMDLIFSREQQICENIKRAVFELVHDLNYVNSLVQRSDYLVEKLGMSYSNLSRIFSRHEHLTLEKYIVLNKIERVKELLDSNEFTLSEIAFMMDYSSVQYLSQQFRKFSGMTVSEYRLSENKERVFLDEIIRKWRDEAHEPQETSELDPASSD